MKKNNKIKTVSNLKYRKVAYAISLLLLGGVLGCFISNFNIQPYDVNVTDELRVEGCHNYHGLELSNIHIIREKGYRPRIVATVTNNSVYPVTKIWYEFNKVRSSYGVFIAPHSSITSNFRDIYIDTKNGKYLFCLDGSKSIYNKYDIEKLKEEYPYIWGNYKEWFDSLSKEEQGKFMKLLEE